MSMNIKIISRMVRAGRVKKKKSTEQDRKKVTKGLYITYLGRGPTQAIYIKNCVLSDVIDVITCANF